ncbi:glycerophosphodiester phosphodiesterase family protein [Alteribacillus sp. YIM 98480]|uniref:glycerophosphodiester phosphodiesterase family protein n=1 Tax=Alteribacillus sp. YIM 98480 TaxID=2606599 RepID=UPI00131B16E3|nr:glycerophosphodiester phosphodiesterase family protein [Alteribacillus sp. YIM 98480]
MSPAFRKKISAPVVWFMFLLWLFSFLSSTEAQVEAETTPKVLISQIMYDTPGSDRGKEYIVIKNYDNKQVDVSGYMIGDGINEGKGQGMAAFPEGTVIEPDQEIFIAHSGHIFKEVYGAVPDFEFPWTGPNKMEDDPETPDMLTTDWSTGTVLLANGGDQVLLMNPDNEIVDFVPYIKDINYRDVAYNAVNARADGNGESIHRVDKTGDPSIDFDADQRQLPNEKTTVQKNNELLITEAVYTPLFDEENGEYVEITNISGEKLDIGGYYFGDKVVEGGASNEAMFQFPENTIIEPYEVMIIAKKSTEVEDLYGVKATFELEETDPDVPNMEENCDWGCGKYLMGNPGDEIFLLDNEKNLEDAFVYKAGIFRGIKAHPGVRAQGHSLERISERDTTNSAEDFVEQPSPTPGTLLFGEHGRPDLIPDAKWKENVLQVNEPETAIEAGPTLIDSADNSDTLPSNVPSYLLKIGKNEDGEMEVLNRNMGLRTALEKIKGEMLPVIEINENQLIEPVHEVLEDAEKSDVLIVSESSETVKEMRKQNEEYQGAVRFEGTSLNENELEKIVNDVRRSTGFVAMIEHQALSKEKIQHLRDRHVTVWSYGVHTEHEVHQMIQLGVAGIETTNSSKAADVLAEYDNPDSLSQQPVMIAHRGMMTLAPENTMPAFEKAVDRGVEVIEADVQTSKDGVPVIIHDYTVDGTTNGTGKVEDLTLNELKSLRASNGWDEYPDVEIPTLKELLEYAQDEDVVINLELKSEGNEEKVLELVESFDMLPDVYFSSFNHKAVNKIKKLNPAAGTANIWHERGPGDHNPFVYAEKIASESVQSGMFVQSKAETMTPELVSYAKHRGIPLIHGGLNTKWDVLKAVEKGATAILNDYPHWMDDVPHSFVTVSDNHYLKAGQTISMDDIDAGIVTKTGETKNVEGGWKAIGPNKGVVEIDNNQDVKALQQGKVTLQLYHEYQPFNKRVDGDPALLRDTWRMHSTPITLTVLADDPSIEVTRSLLEEYDSAEKVKGPLVPQLNNSLKQAEHHSNKGSTEKAVSFLEKFIQQLEKKSMEEHVTEDAKEILLLNVQALIDSLSEN